MASLVAGFLVYGVGALTYIWTQIISKVLPGELGSMRKSVGIGLILVGVTVVASPAITMHSNAIEVTGL